MKDQRTSKPTSADVAARAGVSQPSVSLILNGNTRISFSDETRERVFAAARELGYQPPAHKNKKRTDSRLIAVLIPTLTNPYYAELVQALEQVADASDYRVLVCNTFRKKELEKDYLQRFHSPDVAGIVYTFLPDYPTEVTQISRTVPVVLIGEKTAELPICSIELSNRKAGAIMAEHLYHLGHRHAVFITTPMNRITLSRKQRLDGLQQQFSSCSRDTGEDVRIDVLSASGGPEADAVPGSMPYEFQIGKQLTEDFLSRQIDATALIGVNDMIAMGILAALQEHGLRVPEDYSVCGFDNIFTSMVVTPSLTTVDHRLWARCRSAIDLINEQNTFSGQLQKDAMLADKIEYAPQLIARGSTGQVPRRG